MALRKSLSLFTISTHPDTLLWISAIIAFIVAEFQNTGLNLSAEMIEEIIKELQGDTRHMFDWLITQTTNIEKLAEKELNGRFFLYIPPERAMFWPTQRNQNIFGDDVAAKFPSAAFDISNSGVCLATMMPTASVFYLMRTLEIGLRALGDVLRVSTDHKNWQNALEQIESKIREMPRDPEWKAQPDWKDKHQYFSECAAHFSILKDAWRNHTMHGRSIYNEDQGELIFRTVKAFMQKLAQRLNE